MSGQNGYGNGYGYTSSGRYDANDGGYGGNSNPAVEGYGGRAAPPGGGGRSDRRPGGYGGFYPDAPPPPALSPGQSPAPGQSPERRRDRTDRGWQQPSPQPSSNPSSHPSSQASSHPSSRSRTRNQEPDRKYQEERSRDANRYADNRDQRDQRDPRGQRDHRDHRDKRDPREQREQRDHRSQRNASPVVNSSNDSGEPQAIETILQSIQRDWDFMTDSECVPVHVALSLMDTSTLGKADREPEFLHMYNDIQKTLKAIVNEHHQGFNSSIGTYHKIQSNISSSQARVRSLRHALDQAKTGLISTKPELKGLATSSQNYDDIVQLFTQIEEIQSLPEKLESQISDKRFLAAVDVLHTGLRVLRRSELEDIGALSDIRAYFTNQETSLTDILIEELHDHLYLKSPYCSDRWKAPASDEKEVHTSNLAGSRSWERPVYSFLAKFDPLTPMVEDASRNPEADTFSYIQLLIEALNKMGHLDVAVHRIEQRLPVELFAVVDKTNAEVDTRYPAPTKSFSAQDNYKQSSLPTEIIEKRGHVLSEFLWALYAKFEAIAEGHRILHDVIAAIVEREGLIKSETLSGGFKELWKLLQSEIRSLMHDYLATDGDSSVRSRSEENDARRHLYTGNRDKNKKMFKLSDIEQNSEMKAEQDELDEILKSSVPGLVSKSRQKAATSDTTQSNKGNSGTGHKILLEPSVFNMGILLPPSLSFIQRLKDIVPVDSDISMGSLTSFLDDFMVNVFLPQLDETVTDLCTLSFIAADAFTEDPHWAKFSPRPIFRGTIKFMSIVREFSKMLSSIPHDQTFTQLLIDQIVTYYDKCCGWYKAMVTKVSARNRGGEVQLKAAASFADSGDIHDVVDELWKDAGDKKQTLIDTEIDLLLKRTGQVPLQPYDIISDPKTVISLSLLYNSMQWLSSHLARIRLVVEHTADAESSSLTATGRPSRRWTLFGSVKPNRDSINHPVHLPLNHETAVVFDGTLESLHRLGDTAIMTMHVDIRCGIIHMLTKTMSGPNPPNLRNSEPVTPSPNTTDNWWHIIMNQPTAASPTILALNNDLIAFDTNISTYLGSVERWFITSGLARFIDRVFVACTQYIGAMNENGALRLQLDVLVLQQNLKNIIIDPTGDSSESTADLQAQASQEIVALPRSAKFLDWFLEGAEKALDYAKEEKEAFASQGDKALAAGNGEPFTYEELRVLVDLCFSEILRGPRGAESREDFMSAKKASADALLRLNEIMWDAR
ncbi:putative exocyst complex component [Penicillium chrysogenum]|uniref:Exocyst complex component Sec8 n=1 Tax=Penicillium chrysogenum TaxID=5076 RepID=A0A167VXG5_PENCH|nr:putative exocyst complex component [Penicillium chrysogenum]